MLVGSSRERRGFDPSVDPAVTTAMIARARPASSPPWLDLGGRAWSGFRPWLPDGLPAIGPLESGVWVATGHEGAGVCLGPISGELLAAAIAGEEQAAGPVRPAALRRRLATSKARVVGDRQVLQAGDAEQPASPFSEP